MNHKVFALILYLVIWTLPLSSQEPCPDAAQGLSLYEKAQKAETISDNKSAADLYGKAADIFEKCATWANYSTARYNEGIQLLALDENEKALTLFEKLKSTVTEKIGQKANVYALTCHNLGELYFQNNNAAKSLENFNLALNALTNLFGGQSKEVALCLYNIGNTLELAGNYRESISKHLNALSIKQSLQISDSAELMDTYSILGNLYQESGNSDSSNIYFQNALLYSSSKTVDDIRSLSFLKYRIGSLKYSESSFDQAKRSFIESRNLSEYIHDTTSNKYSGIQLYLGLIYERNEQIDSAYFNIKNAYRILKASSGIINQAFINTMIAYARICEKSGKAADAINLYNEALIIASTKFQNPGSINAEINLSLANVYEGVPDFGKAEEYYSQSLKSINNDSIKSAELYANIIIGLANLKAEKNKWQESLQLYDRAVRIIASNNNVNKELTADIQNYLGNLYLKQSEYSRAKEYYEKAYTYFIEKYGKNSLKALSVNETLSGIYLLNGEYAKAIPAFESSLLVKSIKLGPDHPDVADLHNKLASALFETGKIEDAGIHYEKALQILSPISNTEKVKTDALYNNLGIFYKGTGNYRKSIDYFDLSLQLKTALYGSESIQAANVLNNIGTTYDKLGNYEKAMEFYNNAEKLITKQEGDSSLLISDVYINKGNLYNRQMQNDIAIEYYNKALTIKAKFLSSDNLQLANVYNNIGTIYQKNEDYKSALTHFDKALMIRQKVRGDNNPDVAESYNNIANIFLKTNRFAEALEKYKKAEQIYSEFYPNGNILLGNTYNNIGTSYSKENNPDSAIVYFNKSINLYKNIFGDKHPSLSLIYNNLGDLYLKINDFNSALKYYQLSLSANHQYFPVTSPVDEIPLMNGYFDQSVFLNSILSKASAYILRYISADSTKKEMKDLHLALKHYVLGDSLVANMRKSTITKADKIALGETALKCYEGAIEVCTELANFSSDKDSALFFKSKAFSFAEKSKASALLEAMAGQDAMKFSSVPDSLKIKENNLSADISYCEKLLADRPKNEASVRNQLFRFNQEYNNLIKDIETRYPDYNSLKYAGKTTSLNELQNIIDPATQVRMYVIGYSYIYIFCISKNDLEIFTHKVYPSIGDTIKKYRDCLISQSIKYSQEYREISNRLYSYLFPGNPDSESIKNLVIIPDGKLGQIPFETLLYEKHTGSIYAYQDYPYLLKKYAISYSFSASLFYQRITKPSQSNAYQLVAFAPVFTNENTKNIILDNRGGQLTMDGGEKLTSLYKSISPLLSSENEVKEIYSIFDKNGYRSKALLFSSAQKDFILGDSLRNYNIIHFATHGFVNSESPELSGIQLAITNKINDEGILYSGDIYNLKLKAELVVLSACETGLGKITKGEGIIGLSRAFLYAGASNLIVSLWKVSDVSTSELMIEFYKNILGEKEVNHSYSSDLRSAKLKLISDKKFAKPYYWSPFILLGN
jgi:CHAT domain-containing protein/Tfp pilus assembly protein PilF